MNRQELVDAVAEKSGQSKTAVNAVLNELISTIQDTVPGT